MRDLIKSILILAAVVFIAVSCDVSNTNAIYEPSGDNGYAGFLQSTITNTEISTLETSLDIILCRSTADTPLTVAVTTEKLDEISCPPSVTFAAGQYETALTLDISAMKIGKKYSGIIKLTDENSFDKNISRSSTKVTFAKSYVWESCGIMGFYDTFFAETLLKRELFKAEGFNVYRLMDPFPEDIILGYWEGALTGSGPSYIEFSITDGHIDYGDYLKSGYLIEGESLELWSPRALKEAGEEENRIIDGGVAQFYWYQYCPESDSWWGGSYPAYLQMPEFNGDFEAWINEM